MIRIPDEQLADEQIIKKVIEGEVNLFKNIVLRYQEKILSVGMRFHKNRDDAYDLVQDVFIRAFKNLSTFRGEARFYSWLLKIAYNLGINSLKSSKTYDSLADEYIKSNDPAPDTSYLRSEIKKMLQKAVGELPERYRVCIDLYFFYRLTYTEISDITGFPVNTIKSHVLRAKQMLRAALQGTIAEDYDEM